MTGEFISPFSIWTWLIYAAGNFLFIGPLVRDLPIFCTDLQLQATFGLHSQKRIMKPFAFTKPHDFRVFTKEHS